MAASLLQDVSNACAQLQMLRARVASESPSSSDVLRCIDSLVQVLDNEFDLSRQRPQGAKRMLPRETTDVENLTKRKKHVSYEQMKASRLKEALDTTQGSKVAGRIANVWYTRVGLAPANVPSRALAAWCRDFNVEECLPNYFIYINSQGTRCDV
jgi:hypothetical protein